MANCYKIGEFAKIIHVSIKTLQRWDNSGIFRAYRTPTNHRYYTDEHLKAYQQSRPESIVPQGDAKRA